MKCFEAILEPYSRKHDLYQAHYRACLRARCEHAKILYQEKGPTLAGALRFLGALRSTERLPDIVPPETRTAILDRLAGWIGGRSVVQNTIGRYVYRGESGEVRICIDAEDEGGIKVPELLDWSDVYFKTNYWPDLQYDAKVVPLANVSPLVLPRLAGLLGYRNSEAEWDLFGFFRVWGRIEQSLALFEALAQLRCRKKLLAYLISADNTKEVERLEKAGVAWTTKPIPLKELWNIAARSRLNIVRHGVGDCIPWRMTDVLAMGHCPVLDYRARTEWHVPLVENVHYLSLDLPPDTPLPLAAFNRRVAERVEAWLSTKDLIEGVAENAAAYFDNHLTPEPMGRYLLEHARRPAAPAPAL